MIHTVLSDLLALAFFGAGVVNMIGAAKVRDDFARWGYPRWWCRLTGGLEIAAAALIVLPATRSAGLALGAVVIAAALATLLRRRELSHLPPLGVFAALIALSALTA